MAAHTSTSKALLSHYPWTSTPLITSAPMQPMATSPLALAVSQAGGLGFIAAGNSLSNLSSLLDEATSSTQTSPIRSTPEGILPIGVGFVCFNADLSIAMSAIESAPLKPAAAWLFAPREVKDFVAWTTGIRQASQNKTKIWVQIGTVEMALTTARECKPDVLVLQGADAGGHGLSQSSSVISLVPECSDSLEREGYSDIPLIAAGGIMDGRGVAAAVMLGADGVCMGTRFLTSHEAVISDGYRNALLAAKDGGVSTVRTKVYDRIRGTPWPSIYDGRAVVNQTFYDSENGISEEENKKLYVEAVKLGDAGWGENGRITTYAGSGVGLAHKVMPASDIVREVLQSSRRYLSTAASKL